MQPPKIGNVVRVASGRVDVVITTRDLNLVFEDRTYRVGQLGSYVTIPMDDRTLVGFVTAAGRQDTTVVDIEPQLILDVQLLGEIRDGNFARGVSEYPIVGDEVWAAIRKDFETIFGTFEKITSKTRHPTHFSMGRFAYNQDFEVKILGTPFLSKHVGVLGNSGSGKSCTTSKMLQEILDLTESQVVLFDMHGEYRAAFSDEDGQINANVTYLGTEDLVLPYWLLKYEELEALFVDRSNPQTISTQISFLRTALLEYKMDAARELGLSRTLTLDTPIFFSLDMFKTYAENLNEARYVLNDDHLAFSQLGLRSLPPDEQQRLMRVQRCQFNRGNPEGETPHPLYFGRLLGLIDRIDTMYNDRRYQFLLRPIEHGIKSRYFRDQLMHESSAGQSSGLLNHLIKLLTGRVEPRSNLTIVDLSGIPFEIVDITVAVMTRLLFDVNFWTPAAQRHPILLVFEEAHNYIPRHNEGRQFARKIVERVAKEGRKYGVSAMVISQRPSELSETVLAQCNNFVVMRISNPEDQMYVRKVVGDQFAGVIQMLPVLRPGEAFIIGDSVLMPMRTLVDLPNPQPLSADADFFKAWSASKANSDIDEVIEHWRKQDRAAMNRAMYGEDQQIAPGRAAPRSRPAAPPTPFPPSRHQTPGQTPPGSRPGQPYIPGQRAAGGHPGATGQPTGPGFVPGSSGQQVSPEGEMSEDDESIPAPPPPPKRSRWLVG